MTTLLATLAGRANQHLFELIAATAWVTIGFAYLLQPARALAMSPVGEFVAPMFVISWSLFEVVGGLLLLHALVAGHPHQRVAGLVLLASGLLMHGTAAVAAGLALRDLVYFLYAAACILRALTVTNIVRSERAW